MEISLLNCQFHSINLLYRTEDQRHHRLCGSPEYHQRTQPEDAGVPILTFYDGELDVELRTLKFPVPVYIM